MTAPMLVLRVRRVSRRAAALALFALLAVPGVLLAHARLVKSTPVAGVTLAGSPDAVSLWFSEAPELTFTKIALLGPDSSPVPLGEVRHVPGAPLAVTATVPSALGPGRYTVVWQTAAADGHPSRGRFSFSVAPTAGATTGPAPAAAQRRDDAARQAMPPGHEGEGAAAGESTAFDADAPLSVAVRWLAFASLIAIIGACAFRWLVLPGAARSATRHARTHGLAAVGVSVLRRAARLGVVSAVLLLATALVRLVIESYAMHGAVDAMNIRGMAAMLGDTTWGVAWLVQVVAAIVALAAFALAGGRVLPDTEWSWRSRSEPWAAAALAALVLAFTPAMAGHAASSPRLTSLAIVADGLHVLGAGGWLGSLLVVVGLGVPAALALAAADERGPAVADLVNAFSPTALAFASLVALTGVFAGWLHLGSLSPLWRSAYGRTLLVKLALLSVLAFTAAYNWLRVRPALGDAEGARRMRRSATVELTVAALVLIVTAILVALPTPLHATAAVR